MNKSDTTNFIRAFVAIFKQMKIEIKRSRMVDFWSEEFHHHFKNYKKDKSTHVISLVVNINGNEITGSPIAIYPAELKEVVESEKQFLTEEYTFNKIDY